MYIQNSPNPKGDFLHGYTDVSVENRDSRYFSMPTYLATMANLLMQISSPILNLICDSLCRSRASQQASQHFWMTFSSRIFMCRSKLFVTIFFISSGSKMITFRVVSRFKMPRSSSQFTTPAKST